MNQQLENQIITLLKRANEPEGKKSHALIEFINSPFFLTLVAGAILTLLASCLSSSYEKETEDRQARQALKDSQIQTIKEFSSGYVQFVQSSFGMRKREIWLALNQLDSKKQDLKYPDGRDYSQSRDFYEKQRAYYNSLPHPDTLCAHASAIFAESEQIRTSIEELKSIMDSYVSINSYDVLYDSFDSANKKHDEIIRLMGQHILLKTPTK